MIDPLKQGVSSKKIRVYMKVAELILQKGKVAGAIVICAVLGYGYRMGWETDRDLGSVETRLIDAILDTEGIKSDLEHQQDSMDGIASMTKNTADQITELRHRLAISDAARQADIQKLADSVQRDMKVRSTEFLSLEGKLDEAIGRAKAAEAEAQDARSRAATAEERLSDMANHVGQLRTILESIRLVDNSPIFDKAESVALEMIRRTDIAPEALASLRSLSDVDLDGQLSDHEIGPFNQTLARFDYKSTVTFETKEPDAAVFFQLISKREASKATQLTECEETIPIGIYRIWTERNGKATSKKEKYKIIRKKMRIEIEEF